jgi:hypothetical protein
MAKNKNENPLENMEELKDEISFENFSYKYGKKFELICNLVPNKEKEKLEIKAESEEINKRCLAYIFVIEDKIFKVGHTIRSMKERIGSYNGGKGKYREKYISGETNYIILQSILNIGKKVKVHAFFLEKPKYELLGKDYQDCYPPPSRVKKIILTDFEERYGKLPIGCARK